MRKKLIRNRTQVKRKQTPHRTKTRLRKTQKTNHQTKSRKSHYSQNIRKSAKRGTQNQSQQTPPRKKWIRKSPRNSNPKRWRAIRTQGE